jgi:signal transduction histidine kinase
MPAASSAGPAILCSSVSRRAAAVSSVRRRLTSSARTRTALRADATVRDVSRFRLDWLLALLLTVGGELEILLGPSYDRNRLVSALVLPVATLPLAWRRRVPVLPVTAVAVALMAQGPLDGFLVGHAIAPIVAAAVALYSAGRHVAGPRGLAVAVAAALVIAASRVAFDPAVERAGDAVLTLIAVLLPLLVGRWVRGQVLLQRELESKADRLLRERERDARQAAEEERIRIATDLQAAIADGLRTIVRRAADLPGVLADHAEARAQLATLATTAREALADVRRVLGVLRHDGEPPRLAPAAAAQATSSLPAVEAADAPAPPPAVVGSRSPLRRGLPLSRRALDVLVVAVILVAAEVELAAVADESLVAALTAVAIAVPLFWRRAYPLPVAAAVLGSIAVQSALLDLDSFPFSDIAAVTCAAYAIGAHAERRAAIAGLVLAAAGAAVHAAVFYPDGVAPALLGGVVAPWTVGRVVRGQRLLTREGRQEAARIELARAREARAAVTAERMRVARELHDAVAHNLSVIAIQAAGADGIVERDPQRAAECAALIETVAREALAELDRLVGPATAPQPSLAGVDALAERTRAGGLPVDLQVEGDRDALPAGVDLAAYRIVQEALANTSKHARASRAWISIRYEPRAVEVEVRDDGRAGATSNGSGHGLIGMRERAALYGGTLDARHRPAGGFVVHARLPHSRP